MSQGLSEGLNILESQNERIAEPFETPLFPLV